MSIRLTEPLTSPYPNNIDLLVEVDFNDILQGIEHLNDTVEGLILQYSAVAMLNDISYQVIGGHSAGKEYIGGTVLLRVQAEIQTND